MLPVMVNYTSVSDLGKVVLHVEQYTYSMWYSATLWVKEAPQ